VDSLSASAGGEDAIDLIDWTITALRRFFCGTGANNSNVVQARRTFNLRQQVGRDVTRDLFSHNVNAY
jgi:hypothetical protein